MRTPNVIRYRGATASTPTSRQFKAEAIAMAREHLARTGAPVMPAASQDAVLQAHQDAENALSMALHYLRSGARNIPGATRKAVQALAALNNLQAISPAGAGACVQIGRA